MSHYEERLEKDLQHIRAEVSKMAQLVELSVKNAVHALLTGNEELASATILADGHINRMMRKIDGLCHSFIAVHLPSASHLRLMSSVFRSNILLERIGDYSVTICRETLQLSAPIDGHLARGIEAMANDARKMLTQAIQAFETGNAEMARATMVMAEQIQTLFSAQFAELLDDSAQWQLRDRFAVFVVYHRLERLSDQAKNLCEEAIFWTTGETKVKKVYRVLFLDSDNSALSLMAQAIASKNHPEIGIYQSAGKTAARQAQPAVLSYLEQRGLAVAQLAPSALDLTPVELAECHVIVSLDGPVKAYFESLPFHSVLLNWDVAPAASIELTDAELSEAELEEVYRKLAVLIKDLMFELRGEDAN
jgi:phosphate transport system protein